MPSAELPQRYRLVDGPPAVEEYLELRRGSGLTPKRRDQAAAALAGSWAAVHVVCEAGGPTVGMGRVIGDGGWYFHVVDMAVLPEHQRRGLGDAILTAPLDRIRAWRGCSTNRPWCARRPGGGRPRGSVPPPPAHAP